MAEPMSATTGAAMARLLSISVGKISTCTKRVVGDQRGPLPWARSQFRRAPISITTSAWARTRERAAAADCLWLSGRRPFAIDIGRYGMPVISMKDRISSSACAYAAPLPRMMSGRWALASKSRARLIDSGSGMWRGAGSTTRTSESVGRVGVEGRAKDFGGQIEVDATRPP